MRRVPKTSSSPPVAYLGVIVIAGALAACASGIVLADLFGRALGSQSRALDVLLLFLVVGYRAALGHPETAWIGVCLLASAAYRYYRLGYRVDWGVAVAPLAMAAIVASAIYADWAAHRYQGSHAQALEDAIHQGERRHLRETVFACEAFCGYRDDPSALVWLTAHAEERADFNAIGRMLHGGARRDLRSTWLDDHRTAMEVALERYPSLPALTRYVLGLEYGDLHFLVSRASRAELGVALRYARAKGLPSDLQQLLIDAGAQPTP